MMIKLSASLVLAALVAGPALAKLPAATDEAKAKAAEAAAKTAWGDKVAGFQLCKSMERVVAAYRAGAKKAGKDAKPATDTPGCAEPGPFSYAPAEPKPPLEAAGAHSPPKTATAPPSTITPAAEIAPKK